MKPKGIYVTGLEPAVQGAEPRRRASARRKIKKGTAHERSYNRGETERREGYSGSRRRP